jgi:hypothetical protein
VPGRRGYSCGVRPLTFWTLVAAAIFLTMTVLWVFGGEPEGAIFVISTILYWASGLALIVAGMLFIGRFARGGRERRRGGTATADTAGADPAGGGTRAGSG